MQVSFTIPGRIGGKGRPKFARRGNLVTAYTPEKTRSTEALIRQFAAEAMQGKPLLDGPVRLVILLRLNHPASWSKRRKAETVYVCGKPDADNIIKIIGDAANGVIWKDDSLIAEISFNRRYSDNPEYVAVTALELKCEQRAEARQGRAA